MKDNTNLAKIQTDWRDAAQRQHEEMKEWEEPQSFIFEEGAILTGKILYFEESLTEYGPHPVVVVETADGKTWKIRAFHKVLKSKLERLNPRPGDILTVRRLADAEHYKNYAVKVGGRRSQQADFSAYLSEQEQPALPEAAEAEITDDDIPF